MDSRSQETLADLLLEWEDRFFLGEDIPAEELAREHPALVRTLEARIRILKSAGWLDLPGATDEAAEDGDGDGDSDGGAPPSLLAGRYRLDRRIAEGGFAEVWLAHDAQLDRAVAIKLPKATRIDSAAAILAEARRVARLIHPNIIPVHDVGIEQDTCFIVSDYLEGGSLADRLAAGPVGPRIAVRWICQVAEALDFAHRQGMTHRDVKPGNILLNDHGNAVLGDFGIARTGAVDEAEAPIGTLRYMPPEQLAGQPCTPRSDVYSLGVVLHETLCGELPYDSVDPGSLRGAIAGEGNVRISATIPKPLAAVCRQALCHAPEGRQASAAEFARELRRAEAPLVRSWPAVLAAPALALAAIPLAIFLGPVSRDAGMVGDTASGTVQPGGSGLAFEPSGLVPLLNPSGDPPVAHVGCRTIGEALPYVVEAVNVRLYREWQDPPITYFGPQQDGVEGRIVFHFDFPFAVQSARLVCSSFCVDFDHEPGGEGRGASSLEVSRDGEEWVALYDNLAPRRWGGRWDHNDVLPQEVLGTTSIYLRVRMLSSGCPNDDYTCAQFGRPAPHPLYHVLDVTAQLERATD